MKNLEKQSVLKKQFREEDIQRVRNLVTGKYGSKINQSVGYKKPDIIRKEGEVWEEDGRTWTIKKGIKQNITKLDKVKKAYITPLFCPNCKKIMNGQHDSDYYKIHKMCLNCVVDKEHQLKIDGKWEEYEKTIHNNEIDSRIKDFKAYVKERLSESNDSFMSEAGDKETWKGKIDTDRVEESVNEIISQLESLKK